MGCLIFQLCICIIQFENYLGRSSNAVSDLSSSNTILIILFPCLENFLMGKIQTISLAIKTLPPGPQLPFQCHFQTRLRFRRTVNNTPLFLYLCTLRRMPMGKCDFRSAPRQVCWRLTSALSLLPHLVTDIARIPQASPAGAGPWRMFAQCWATSLKAAAACLVL